MWKEGQRPRADKASPAGCRDLRARRSELKWLKQRPLKHAVCDVAELLGKRPGSTTLGVSLTHPTQRASQGSDPKLEASLLFLCPSYSLLLVSTSFQSGKESRDANTPCQAPGDKAAGVGLPDSEPVKGQG